MTQSEIILRMQLLGSALIAQSQLAQRELEEIRLDMERAIERLRPIVQRGKVVQLRKEVRPC